ncbi:type II restriction endonuclease [Macellibacteroides fermentans]
MDREIFLQKLQQEVGYFNSILSTERGDWIVKGFIDIYKNIYTITLDTKVVSKVIEILLIPAFNKFAEKNNLKLELAPQQNFYPDLTFICKDSGEKYAVDIKSTMKDDENKIKSMTLGAFTGYFRNRASSKNTKYPYGDYSGHFVFGVVYTQIIDSVNEKEKYTIDELGEIQSVIKDFVFFVQPKYKIATDRPGSGNTKNIGSVANLDDLINGNGKFSTLGEDIFDDYWMFYLTKDMAKDVGLNEPPYNNLITYFEYKKKGLETLQANEDLINKMTQTDLEQDNAE